MAPLDLGKSDMTDILNQRRGRQIVDTTPSMLTAVAMQKQARKIIDGGATSRAMLPPLRQPTLPSYVVLTQAQPPYAILWASTPWLDLCRFRADEIVGGDFKCIQGPATDRGAIKLMMERVQLKQAVTLPGLINYDKHRRPFRHTLAILPERDSDGQLDEVRSFRAVSTNVCRSSGGVFIAEGSADMEADEMDEQDELDLLDLWSGRDADVPQQKRQRHDLR
jgi:hypothetical protein